MSTTGNPVSTALRATVMALAALTGASILVMVALTCVDVVMRLFGRPVFGVYDMVYVCGAVGMACALPYTTALKGHVAIEYFLHKCGRRWRAGVESAVRLPGAALFCLLAVETARTGGKMYGRGDVSATLQLPVFWLMHVIAFCCAVTAAVIVHDLVKPGRELVKP